MSYDRNRERYKNAIRNCEKTGRSFELTELEFYQVSTPPCVYCGENIEPRGVDKIDPEIGYCKKNVVSACWKCNQMKYTSSVKDFILHIYKIYFHRSSQKEMVPNFDQPMPDGGF